MSFSRSILIVAATAVLCAATGASPHVTVVTPQTAKWQPVPGLKGAQMAIVVGNPSTAGGYYEYLLKLPAGTRIPPHFHKMTENVTIISGTFTFGLGDTMNEASMSTGSPGTTVSVPGGLHHYAIAKDQVIVEISGIGPDTTTFVKK